ncbi:RDD family protein [Streptomyces candidus]|uniref:Putative RDD family membrane protein YckC n=1 Tax=Streptomyces candidus TaxID=67283 RepID=A0A7X0HFP0_9ACTN|nr:RDD family protein [Streptomyces candidus]MBB6435323.1 putative RDD family membrane protein YckC [Streptomyces candidus]GHH47921.1 membrane protein [Streptomyces candidus]
MSRFVTGDAVVLGVRPARLPTRALALLIDMVVVWTAYLALVLALAVATASLDDAATAAVMVASFLLFLVGAPIAVETLTRGRSLGKLACGLRVVRDDGGPIRFRHALVRGAVGVVEILGTFGVVACIASLVSPRGRRIGDVLAGTLVVRERVSAGRAGAVPPPPLWLVGRFAGLDLSRVPDGLWLAVRQYLTRMAQLDPQVGGAMAQRLAGDLAGYTGVSAPQEAPAAAYLAAVVHERQLRDARRAFPGAAGPGGAVGPRVTGPSAVTHEAEGPWGRAPGEAVPRSAGDTQTRGPSEAVAQGAGEVWGRPGGFVSERAGGVAGQGAAESASPLVVPDSADGRVGAPGTALPVSEVPVTAPEGGSRGGTGDDRPRRTGFAPPS